MSGLGCTDGPSSADDHKQIGMQAFVDGHYAKARSNFLKALAQKPSDKDILYFIGLAYQRDFILDSAFYYIKRVNLLHPDDRELTEQLYEISSIFGEFDTARDALMKLVSMGDPLSKHIKSLVSMLEKSGSITNTFYYLRLWYRDHGMNDIDYFRMLTAYASKIDSFDVAWEVLDSAVTRWGDSDNFQMLRSEILFKEKRFEESEVILRAMVVKYPDIFDYKRNLANSLCNQNSIPKMNEGLAMLRELRALASDTAPMDSLITLLEDQRDKLLDSTNQSK